MSIQLKLPAKIGVIGCGNISSIYFKAGMRFKDIEIFACADLDQSKAEAKAQEFNIPKILSVEQILEDPEIDIILNITIPSAHFSVSKQALNAGKHVYIEKPLALNMEEGKDLIELAHNNGLRIGCAPDTFLGGAHQTCRKLIDDGAIGRPVGGNAFMMCPGHESWHPAPAFYYQRGGGPMFDMGPYYITDLVNLFGQIKCVTARTRITRAERTITSKPLHGTNIEVEVPTHIAGIMEFDNGAICTLTTSFDVNYHTMPPIEIYGTEGSMLVPDPNGFGGEIKLRQKGDLEWKTVPNEFGYSDNSRGLGLAEMVRAIAEDRHHLASGELGLHILEAMEGFHISSDTNITYMMKSTLKQPNQFSKNLIDGEVK